MTRRSNVFGSLFVAVVMATTVMASLPNVAHAQYGYDNTITRVGTALNGGAENQAGNIITKLVGDDINTTVYGSGQYITAFAFTAYNANATAITVRPRVRFYSMDGVGGGPGTYISGFTLTAASFAGNTVTTYSTSIAAASYINMAAIPNGKFWAAITFDNNTGATGATIDQLNNFGQGIYNPVSIGSSTDSYFISSSAGSFVSNNPTGTLSNFGGSPAANFGWRFTIVPETNTFAMFAMGIVPVAGIVLARRRKKA